MPQSINPPWHTTKFVLTLANPGAYWECNKDIRQHAKRCRVIVWRRKIAPMAIDRDLID
jgi:hypothetical protein